MKTAIRMSTPVAIILSLLSLSSFTVLNNLPHLSSSASSIQEVATGLEAPWSTAFAPDGTIYLTERPGRIRAIRHGILDPTPAAELPVAAVGEAGLLGLALDPDFETNRRAYAYYTYRDTQGQLWNRVSVLVENSGSFTVTRILIDGILGEVIHDGGRLAIGPDAKLYITTGDANARMLAQDRTSLNGKILRLNLDGSVPSDNPDPNTPVYTLGHRNPQGLAWDPEGRMVASEHGPSASDEINLIIKGENYGWPNITGTSANPLFMDPIVSTGTETWAPSGITIYTSTRIADWTGNLFVATLRGQHLHMLKLDLTTTPPRVVSSTRLLDGILGRLRDVVQGPDGSLYIATSNRDGRGLPNPGDDKILRISNSTDLPSGLSPTFTYILYGVTASVVAVVAFIALRATRKRRKTLRPPPGG